MKSSDAGPMCSAQRSTITLCDASRTLNRQQGFFYNYLRIWYLDSWTCLFALQMMDERLQHRRLSCPIFWQAGQNYRHVRQLAAVECADPLSG